MSRFGFKSGIGLLIAPVPVHCFSVTSIRLFKTSRNIFYARRLLKAFSIGPV